MPKIKKESVEDLPKKLSKNEYISAIGRRRESVARVRLYPDSKNVLILENELKKGDISVNSLPIEKYFVGEVSKAYYMEPLVLTSSQGKFIITVKVQGGGNKGQLEAFIHGLSRALANYDKDGFKKILKKKGFLTRDARTRERRKVGTGGKARRKKQSPKR